MISKDARLSFEALISEMVYGHGFLHYGYWPEGPPEAPSAEALGRAQRVYFEHMLAHIPEGVRSIFDVGSGTGANARALVERGFDVACVCPSQQLNLMARRKLPDYVPVHTARFEDVDLGRQFDFCLFAESFHYIALPAALAQTARYARQGALIFDYFRRGDGEGPRGTHAAFLAEVARQGVFQVAQDEDVTKWIAPTFYVLDTLKNRHLGPFVAQARADYRRSHRVRAALAEALFGRTLDRLQRPSARERSFVERFEYRLIRLDRAGIFGA